MIVTESLIEFVLKKDKFKYFKPKEKRTRDDEPDKASMNLGTILSSIEAKKNRENEKKLEGALKRSISKLGLSVSKLTKKIKMVNSKYVPTVGINALLIPFIDCIYILDIRQQQYVVLVSQNMRVGTKVLSAIQLVEYAYDVKNIDLAVESSNATNEVHLKHLSSVLHYDLLLAWKRHRGPFRVLKWISQGSYKPELVRILKVNPMFNVGMFKPIYVDHWDLDRRKSQ
ncbi:hypothetical protein Golob_013252 [Gossypium lobatum]|uniref:Uncharacterized protein n=1 Tax=Gossypium lobatum TaxID=34289 RepID=A0A7J8LNV3_9ROSI|nr:hypothetical protein [Gossypium lobatum]